MTQPLVVVDDFLPAELAVAMRRDIEAHFSAPEHRAEAARDIWSYWHGPGPHTCLRASPERVIEGGRVDLFVSALRQWSIGVLGFGAMNRPLLSMYVPGCRQGVHSDPSNGRFAFAYSLTSDARKTTGGETVLFREGDLLRDTVGKAGASLFASVPPKFNRLVIFDDRLPHAVERVEGSMAPRDARFVLQGEISENGAHVNGALTAEQVKAASVGVLEGFCETAFARIRLYHGPLVLRLDVDAKGAATAAWVMLDRVVSANPGDTDWSQLRAKLVAAFAAVKFPEASGPSAIIQPVLFGATLFRR